MNLAIVSVFGIFLAFIIVSVIAGVIVYTAIYNARIKKRLSQGVTTGRQWPQPKSIVMIILIVALGIICVVSVINGFSRTRNNPVNINNIGYAESFLSYELKDSQFEHYIDAYETGKLSGYTLTEATEDEFSYKYFRSENYFDLIHPSFVLFVEYTGNDDFKGYSDSIAISYGSEGGASGFECGETSDYFCVIGNVNHLEGHAVTYQLNLHKTEADALSYFDNMTDENELEAFSSGEKSIIFTTTEDSILVLK